MAHRPSPRFAVEAALQTLADVRGPGQVVVTNQGSARLWPRLSQHAGDFNYNPSTMGGAIALGLGVALAQPEREVVVVSGDGSLLMSLGTLVTVCASGATNITIILLENGIYEVTGGQRLPIAGEETDFVGLAKASGFATATRVTSLEDWQQRAATLMTAAGPRFIGLPVAPVQNDCLSDPSEPMPQQLARLRSLLDEPSVG